MNKKTREKFDKQVSFLGLANIEKKAAEKLNQKELAALQGGAGCFCVGDPVWYVLSSLMVDGG